MSLQNKSVLNVGQRSFSIEGNIGVGKSTFLDVIKRYLNVQVVFEPDAQWQEVGGENLLERFYTDTPRWAYTFQSYAFVTRVMSQEAHAKTNIYPAQVLERSVFSDRYCFAKNCYELGLMTPLEWKLYQEWLSWLVYGYTVKPSGFIYLRAEPELCFERLVKRSRQAENTVSLDYLEKLHQKHEAWLIKKEDVAPSIKNIPVLVLDCNPDFENNGAEQEKHIEKIVNFIGVGDACLIQKDMHSSLNL